MAIDLKYLRREGRGAPGLACGELCLEAADEIECLRRLRALSRALCDKLDECAPHIASAFVLGAVHGARYTGPSYADELAALKIALSQPTK